MDLICLLLVAARRRGRSRVRSSGSVDSSGVSDIHCGFPLFQRSTWNLSTDRIKLTIDTKYPIFIRATMLLVTFFRSVVKRPNQRNQRGSPWSASAQQTRFISPPVDFFIAPRQRFFLSSFSSSPALVPHRSLFASPSHHAHPIVVCIK